MLMLSNKSVSELVPLPVYSHHDIMNFICYGLTKILSFKLCTTKIDFFLVKIHFRTTIIFQTLSISGHHASENTGKHSCSVADVNTAVSDQYLSGPITVHLLSLAAVGMRTEAPAELLCSLFVCVRRLRK